MNNKHTCLAADDFTEAAWGRLEVGFQNWKAASFMAEIPALQVIPPSCWGNQFAKWKPGSLFPPLTNNWTSFPFSCLVMGAEEGGEGLKLQWISKLVCYWREWRGEVYSTWKCRTCRNCVANSRMSGQLRITCEPLAQLNISFRNQVLAPVSTSAVELHKILYCGTWWFWVFLLFFRLSTHTKSLWNIISLVKLYPHT